MPMYRAHDRALLTPMNDGTGVLLNLDTKFYYTLNATGVAIWKRLQATPAPDTEELVRGLIVEFDVDADTARHDVEELIAALLDEGMVRRA